MKQQIIQWAQQQPQVRAVILTSTFAIPDGPVDLLSDYDPILVLNDILPFFNDRTWLGDFGPLLAVYQDPLQDEYGYPRSGYVVQYDNGLKIDFTLWPVEILRHVVNLPQLPVELDAGYEVLLDKDELTAELKPPTYRGYIPAPPDEARYRHVIENFYLDTFYVAKFLWRDDPMAAKYLDVFNKDEHVRPMLEWLVEIDQNWTVKPGPYGRRMKRNLRPELWAELERTYTGMGTEESWAALFRLVELFRKVAGEVGERLGFQFPEDLHRRSTIYLNTVKNLPPEAQRFPYNTGE